jgi:hypothetical protein
MARLVRHRGFWLLALLLAGFVGLADGTAGEGPAKGKGGQATRITPANYKKLKNGMTEKQVVGILGTPTSTSSQDLGELGTGTILSWRRDGAVIAILMLEGKAVTHKGAFGKEALALVPRLTAKAYARVKFDMTEKEVVALLGPPKEANSPAGMPNVRVLTWRSGANLVTVTFRDGKVEATTAKFSD